jgi:hypothetical protein
VKKGKTCTLKFTASAAPVSATTVHYATSGTAVAGTHYTLGGVPGQVTFLAGQTSANVTLTNTNHGSKSKSATITITSGTGYTIGPNKTASITILGQ